MVGPEELERPARGAPSRRRGCARSRSRRRGRSSGRSGRCSGRRRSRPRPRRRRPCRPRGCRARPPRGSGPAGSTRGRARAPRAGRPASRCARRRRRAARRAGGGPPAAGGTSPAGGRAGGIPGARAGSARPHCASRRRRRARSPCPPTARSIDASRRRVPSRWPRASVATSGPKSSAWSNPAGSSTPPNAMIRPSSSSATISVSVGRRIPVGQLARELVRRRPDRVAHLELGPRERRARELDDPLGVVGRRSYAGCRPRRTLGARRA